MNVTEAIRARRSVRKYQPGVTIPQEHIDLMLEAAMCAPSACNSRPWEFVVVENAAMRQSLSAMHPYCRSLPDASLAILVCGAQPELASVLARALELVVRAFDCPAAAVHLIQPGRPEHQPIAQLDRSGGRLAGFLGDPRVVEIPRALWLPLLYGIILRTRPA